MVVRGQLVEERVLREFERVSFGQSQRCTLSMPLEGLPAHQVLFVRENGKTVLVVKAGMEGRLAHGETIRTLDELRVGPAEQGEWMIPMAAGSRGKIDVAGITLLFQDVAAPPVAPRLTLPASLRGSLADRIDRRLAIILGSSILVHIGIAAWAWSNDVETGSLGTPEAALVYPQETIDVTLPDLTPPPTTEPGTAAPVAPSQVPAPIVRPSRVVTPPHGPPAITDDDAVRLAQILTNDNASEHGPAGMRNRSPGADLDREIAEVRGKPVTIGDDRGGFRNGRTHLGTVPGPTVDAPGEIVRIKPREEQEQPRVVPGPVQTPIGTTLTPAMVLAKINGAYMPGLVRCYRLGLNHDQSLKGKIAIAFTVNETGRVTEAEAHGVGTGVDTCIQHLMTGWHFTSPRTPTGEPTDANFEVSLQLN
jgi:hypothetical protein